MNPFDLIKEWETNDNGLDIEFMASLWTVVFGRYDNESPPLFSIFQRITINFH